MSEETEAKGAIENFVEGECHSRLPSGEAHYEPRRQSRDDSEGNQLSPPTQQNKQPEEEKQENGTLSADDDFPEGGTRAWLVAAGTAGILFCSLGYTNSFGISWIGSIQAFLVFASGAVGGPIFDRYGAWIIRPAAIVYIFSVMMTSLCRDYWQFMLAQGVLSGISNGLIMFPAMAATPQYFLKKRGAAMGLAIAGSSLGAVVFPIVLSELLETVGFSWSVRVCGFIMMPVLLFSALTVRARLPPRKSRFVIWKAFKEPLYLCLVGGVCLMFVGMFIPLFYLSTFGIDHGMTPALASYLVAVINGASIFGRIIPGVLGDKFGRINALFTAGLLTAISILCWPKAETQGSIIGFSAAYGLTSGAIISGGSVVFTLCPKSPKDIGTYMGMGIAFASLSVLIGPPVSGALLNHFHGYNQISIFGGVVCMAGTALTLCAKLFAKEGLFGII
ncbi:riboflavin transporter MCH5 [Colletotrichum caudatum]|nr:riboflavin transporter MCH5 [Colletotrichum caudatum]